MTSNGSERRKQERHDSKLFVEFLHPSLKENLGRGVVVDVSLSGFAVETEADLREGQVYDCHIEIPLRIKAKVMRHLFPGQMKRYGLKFMGPGFFDKLLLKKLLKGDLKTKKI